MCGNPAGSLDARHIVSPLRAFFRKVRFRDSVVDTVDLERKVRVALNWTLDLVFPRDITLLKVLRKTTVAAPADDSPEPAPQPADQRQHERALRT